jgi:nucleoid-associated protein YgaU
MKMDPALKVAMALCVLLGGVCAALMFRRDPPRPVAANRAAHIGTQPRAAPPAPVVPAANRGTLPSEVSPPARPAAVHAPVAVTVHRPETPADSDQVVEGLAASTPWQPPMESAPPLRETASTHRVVDGDSLEGLAKQYLGSPDRAGDIFNANRDVLSDPRLLPIGVELKMPAR